MHWSRQMLQTLVLQLKGEQRTMLFHIPWSLVTARRSGSSSIQFSKDFSKYFKRLFFPLFLSQGSWRVLWFACHANSSESFCL